MSVSVSAHVLACLIVAVCRCRFKTFAIGPLPWVPCPLSVSVSRPPACVDNGILLRTFKLCAFRLQGNRAEINASPTRKRGRHGGALHV